VITLGIDLASRPERTAACTIDWSRGRARIVDLACGLDDAALLARISTADKAGIDAPFGWPEDFVAAVARFHAGGSWPAATVGALRYRATDHVVARVTGRWPLSVSTDLIGVPAFRAARLLTRLAEGGETIDRSGAGRVVETYPAAALRLWGFASTGYKRRDGLPSLGRLLAALRARTQDWLALDPSARRLCARSDDAFDALVAALIARAAALGRCTAPPPEQAERAAAEGWIALPEADSFEALPATPSRGSLVRSAHRTSPASSRRRP
jgi:predicted nuclease with RNAse H fold